MAALIFELDGTLVGSVCANPYAWQRALAERVVVIDGWRSGMSGGPFTRAVARAIGRRLTEDAAHDGRARAASPSGAAARAECPGGRSGSGAAELCRARALGVYRDAAELRESLDGLRIG